MEQLSDGVGDEFDGPGEVSDEWDLRYDLRPTDDFSKKKRRLLYSKLKKSNF
jgi:hypothetical protein